MPAQLMELMRHETIETTLSYYVGRNAERTCRHPLARARKGDGAGAETGREKATRKARQNEHVKGRKTLRLTAAPNSRPLQGVTTRGRPIANPALSRRFCNAGGGT